MRRGAQGALSWDKVKGGACTGTPSFPPGPIKPYYQAQPAWWCPSSANGFISIVPSETRPTAQAQSQECPFSQGAPTSCKPGSCGEASTGRPPTPRGQSQALGALDWPSWRRGSCLAHPQPTGKYLVCIRGGAGLGLCRPRRACFHWGSSQKTWVTLCFLTAAQQAGHVLLEACEDTEGAGRTCLAPLTAPALGPARAVMPGSRVPGVRPGGGVASRPGSSGSHRRGTGRGPRPPPCSRGTPGLRQGGRRERHRPAAWAASPLRKTGLTGTACRGGALAPGLPWCLS